MQLVDEAVVYRNRYPNTRAEVTSAPTLAWSRLGSEEPFLLSAFRVGRSGTTTPPAWSAPTA
jgi:hypothetical protein